MGKRILLLAAAAALLLSCSNDDKFKSVSEYGQFAPPDAYEEDSLFAYYGSENEWNRRMFSEKAATNQYKRMGQRLMLFVIDGEPQKALDESRKWLELYPEDAEIFFIRSVAYCSLGKPAEAWSAAKQALDYGLPVERFLAGPKDLLQPLYDYPAFKKAAGNAPLILHGPMLGAVTDTSARLWLRIAKQTDLRATVWDAGLNGDEQKITFDQVFLPETDYTGVFTFYDLSPATTYRYTLSNTSGIQHSGTFTTRPQSEAAKSVTIAFGGGAGFTPWHEKIWSVIHKLHPDALLLLGDNVYIDLPEMPGAFHDYTYYRRQSVPVFRNLISDVPVYTIWDDHDSGTDDVWMGPYIDRPEWKLPLLQHFQRQWVNPERDDDTPGGYYKFSIGDVDFFMLDCRFYRTNPFKEEKTMLGPEQKAWLKTALQKSEAMFKVIVSSVPWSPGAKPGSHDTWDGFPGEREELFKFITENRIEGVLLMAADRHRTDAWVTENPGGYPLYEFMSSKLTNLHTHDVMPGSLIGYNEKCSFGKITFNLGGDNPSVKFTIVSIDGERIDTIEVARKKLSFIQ